MNYAEAFQRLGYRLAAPRTDWSAANEDGVCLTLWKVELDPEYKRRRLDSRKNCGPIEEWPARGKNLRHQHLSQAVDQHDGWVDVIIVHGTPGVGFGDADPWVVRDRKSRWRVVSFDRETGHFVVELVPTEGK
ncbi:hypothetical protein [Sandarakinorhabdus oryzae]|uniref:hypothetical protein n=1 Tax=Sandarakinorhabdus oryzae TaxID=2675220 RepID=UPI0012E26CF6|nr:hypothetical protein [Sandarakinorhabdus oryzae]